jgi:hypothetical protein
MWFKVQLEKCEKKTNQCSANHHNIDDMFVGIYTQHYENDTLSIHLNSFVHVIIFFSVKIFA